MAPIAEVLEAWPEAFPEFSVIGCGDSRIRYEHAGHEGELYFDWDDETRWWNGKPIPTPLSAVERERLRKTV